MKHSYSVTGFRYFYDLALAVWRMGALGMYYSGFPKWRLRPPDGFPMRVRSFRTFVNYSMQRLPESLRIDDNIVFRWQDRGFDKAISGILDGEGYLHGIPGQCAKTFQRAKELGMTTVLNHASGPWEQQVKLIEPEYRRAGLKLDPNEAVPKSHKERLDLEVALTDFHCVASTVVKKQLVESGVGPQRIWVVPYGADPELFPKRSKVPEGPFRICFAGRQSLRKGIHYLLKALEAIDSSGWELHFFGMQFKETENDLEAYGGGAKIFQNGALSQPSLAKAFKDMHVLVLPSAEEAFGLVVVQALEAGIPCIVSDRVGAKDILKEGKSGSVVPFGNTKALAEALLYWSHNRITVEDSFPWMKCAEQLLFQGSQTG